MSRLKEIHDYVLSIGWTEKEIEYCDKNPILLSGEIMEYAHRNQLRENGILYSEHPSNCVAAYKELAGFRSKNDYGFYANELEDSKIPYFGVLEVCYLHDVLEDTDFTINDLEEIFDECGFLKYFNTRIKNALLKITHDKSVDYEEYIHICMTDPIAAMCKMLDLSDNMNVLTVKELNDDTFERTYNYLKYITLINNKYHFIERCNVFREMMYK